MFPSPTAAPIIAKINERALSHCKCSLIILNPIKLILLFLFLKI
jgi:hypothetical protein